MGFDNECIPNIQSLAGEYFCPVCRLLVYPHEALQSMCTHLYCKPCLTYIAGTSRACPYDGYLVTEPDAKPLVETNKALADTIGKITVCCLYQKSGCTWQGTLSESTSHCSGCAFGNSPVVCNRCGIQIVHRQVQEHAQTCIGMQQPQIQQSQGSEPVVTAGTAVGSNQMQLSIQAGAAVAASQANASQAVSAPAQDPNQKAGVNPLGQAVVAAVPTPEQWYLQQYQQFYQNYSGYYPYQQQAVMANLQQQLQSQSQSPQVASASQYQATPMQPLVQSEPQLQSQTQLQTQSQAVALVVPQSQPVFQAAPASQPQSQTVAGSVPQTYPLVMSSSSVPSQPFPPSQGLQHLQTRSHSQPQPIPQASSSQHHIQHSQVPQYQQFPGQVQSQLNMQPPPSHSQTHTVQNIQPLHPTALAQTQQLSAHVTGLQSYPQPQPNQQNQVGVSQNNMVLPHLVGTQPTSQSPQMQNLYPQQQPHLRLPLSQTPIQAQQLLGTGQFPNIPPTQQLPPHQVGVSVHQRPVMQPAQQHLQQQPHPQLPVLRQLTMGQKPGIVHTQLHQQGPFTHQPPVLQSHIRPQNPPHVLQKYPQNVLPHQPMLPSHGQQPQMNQHPAISLYGGAAQLAPNKPDADLGDIQRTKNQSHSASNEQGEVASRLAVGKQGHLVTNGGKDDKEVGSTSDAAATNPVKTENDAKSNNEEAKTNVESEQSSSTAVEACETKREPLAKQMMEEKASNGLVSPMKNPVLEGKGNGGGPSVRASPLKEADRPNQKIGNMHKDREVPQMHVSVGISSGGNRQPVNPGLLGFQQRAAVPSGQIPMGIQHHVPAPRYPSPAFRPHGPQLLPGTPPCPAAAPSFDGGPRAHGLGHHVADGIYDQDHLPFHAAKISPEAINSFAPGLRDERFKPLPDDRLNPISLQPAGRRLFEEDIKHFPRPSPLDGDAFSRLGAHPLRSFDKGFGMGISLGPRGKHGVDFNSGPTSRFFQASNDLGEASLGSCEDGRERLEAARIHPDFHNPVPGFDHRHIDGPSGPVSEYPRMLSHGYRPLDNGLGGVRSGLDDPEGRDRFGFYSHLLRRESEGHGNLRMGEHLVGGDRRRGDHFGPHGLSGHLRFEEQVGFDGFPHRRPGDPGFRSRYSLQGFPNDGGSFLGDMKPLENSGKRKLTTMGWCRICKVDCETVEGLDLHSQTKEHQKRSMDMVVMIKQNAKKYKLASADYSPLNNPNKMKKANSEDYNSKKKAI